MFEDISKIDSVNTIIKKFSIYKTEKYKYKNFTVSILVNIKKGNIDIIWGKFLKNP